jgi:hypothetical protein
MSKLDDAYQRLDARAKALQAFGVTPWPIVQARMMFHRHRSSTVKWQKEGLAYCYPERLCDLGLRRVGSVIPEFRRDEWSWQGTDFRNSRRTHYGWHTNPDGDVMRDGEGLCWGVVYQLPGRKKITRLVAGYVFGGCDDEDKFPTIDFSEIFERRVGEGELFDMAVECARHADKLAQNAAEDECEHQRKYREEYEEEAA